MKKLLHEIDEKERALRAILFVFLSILHFRLTTIAKSNFG